jgi:DNA-binding GntR family transcriptional regulator
MQKLHSVAVPVLTQDQITELKTIRILLEGEAASVAALKATDIQIVEVSRINEAFFASLRNGNPHQASEYNRKFHLAVVAIAEMPILLATVEMMWARMGPLIHRINLDLRERREYSPKHNHYRAVEGLRRHDADLARVSIQNDIRFTTVVGADEQPPASNNP